MKPGKALLWLCVFLYGALSLYPLLYMAQQSFKPEREIWAEPFRLPSEWTLSHFLKAWEEANFSTYAFNSILVTASVLLLTVYCAFVMGYAFARMNFWGRTLHFSLLLGSMLVPSSMLIVPVYVLSHDLHLLNTHLGLILPYVAGSLILPVVLMKGVFDSVPQELFDAASIDGCGEYRTLFQIVAPIGIPMSATVGILVFTGTWNEYIWAQVSLNDRNLYTLPVGLANLSSNSHNVGYGTVYAAMTMLTVPLIVFFLSTQRFFISAVTEGAVKT